jgi:2-amino-4-hydroxy-6-hydroxymethyldihydropteridine diphosphokinase
MKTGIFLLLGSNLGNRFENIQKAVSEIEGSIGVIVTRSKIYRTAAWGKTDQPDFFNQVIEISTGLQPHDLLSALLQIEKKLGRQRKEQWGARIIDIDILFFNQQKIESSVLSIPHPAIESRRFTLVPLNEIAPSFKHPTSAKTMSELLEECKDPLKVEDAGETLL